jgi:hypothetical protein
MDSEWLGLEALLLAHLRESLPKTVKVLSASDLAGVKEAGQQTPSVQIYHRGYRPVEFQAAGAIQRVEQTWLAVVVVRNAAGQKDGAATRGAASEHCDAVLKALLGWKPSKTYSALQLASGAPPPAWSPGGFGYYPLAFSTSFSIKGASQRPQP